MPTPRALALLLLLLAVLGFSVTAWWIGAPSLTESWKSTRPGVPQEPEFEKAALESRGPERSDSREPAEEEASDSIAHASANMRVVDAEWARVRGRVLDTVGSARGKLLVSDDTRPDHALAWTDADGTFELTVPIGTCLCAAGDGVVTVLQHRVRGPVEFEAAILVAPRVDISGIVTDSNSTPIGGVSLWLDVDLGQLSGVPVSLNGAQPYMRWARADDHGRFSFADIPGGPAIRLNAQHRGYGQSAIPMPAVSTVDLVVRMDSSAPILHTVSGIVVHKDGAPAAGSEVRLGEYNSTRADSDGRFELLLRFDFEDADLLAFLPGFQPAIRSGFGHSLSSQLAPSGDLRLELGPPPLSLEGSVLDHEGNALVGWVVSLVDGLDASLHKLPPDFVESLVSPANARVRSDASGHFHLGGLRESKYVLRAHDPNSLVSVETPPLAAGTRNVEIIVPEDSIWPSLRGHVRTKEGSPLAGVRLTVQVFQRFQRGAVPLIGRSVTSDDAGAFSLERVPRGSLMLACEGEGILAESLPVPVDSDPRRLELIVLRTASFRVMRTSPEAQRADTLRVFTDEQTAGFVMLPGGYGGVQVELADVGSNVLTSSENIRAIVLYAEGKETKRRSVVLVPGRTTDWEL